MVETHGRASVRDSASVRDGASVRIHDDMRIVYCSDAADCVCIVGYFMRIMYSELCIWQRRTAVRLYKYLFFL